MKNSELEIKCLRRGDLIASSGLTLDSDLERSKLGILFCTSFALEPFVVFKAGREVILKRIIIVNRDGSKQIASRAIGLCASLSIDLVNWIDIQGLKFDDKLQIAQSETDCVVSFLRLSLRHPGIFHLAQVTIEYVNQKVIHEFGFIDRKTYYLTHNAGFFSNCTVALLQIARRPDINKVNATYSFNSFKDKKDQDCWSEFFEEITSETGSFSSESDGIGISSCRDEWMSRELMHHSDYSSLDLEQSTPLIRRYFHPSEKVLQRVLLFMRKYKIQLERSIVLCYRGTDKGSEVELQPIEVYTRYARQLLIENPGFRIMIQTDQSQVRDALKDEFMDVAFWLDEMPVTSGNSVIHSIIQENRLEFGINLLASVVLMSRMKFLITHTGNIAYWSILYRGSMAGVYQVK